MNASWPHHLPSPMPRACLPNARFVAHAESPLLPLLAPHAFAQPCLQRKDTPQHAGTAKKTQEADLEHIARKHASVVSTNRQALAAGSQKSHLTCPRATPHVSFVSAARMAQNWRPSLAARYADVYAFARRQLQRYTTAENLLDHQPGKAITIPVVHARYFGSSTRQNGFRSPGRVSRSKIRRVFVTRPETQAQKRLLHR